MAMYALISPGGSPGVTTTGLALALSWPRPVILAECDPAGGAILAGLFAGHLSGAGGLLGLAIAAGRGDGTVRDELPGQLAVLDEGGDRLFLAGLSDPRQAAGVTPAWPAIAAGLAGADRDVIADCGRFDSGLYQPAAVLQRAELVVMVLRPTLRQVAWAMPRLELAAQLLGGTSRLRLLLVGSRAPVCGRPGRGRPNRGRPNRGRGDFGRRDWGRPTPPPALGDLPALDGPPALPVRSALPLRSAASARNALYALSVLAATARPGGPLDGSGSGGRLRRPAGAGSHPGREIEAVLGISVIGALRFDSRTATLLSDGAGRRAGLASRALIADARVVARSMVTAGSPQPPSPDAEDPAGLSNGLGPAPGQQAGEPGGDLR
ncbi:MAG: hypothetical protein ACYCO9_22785 [Streptosporangiaceae bacterium]